MALRSGVAALLATCGALLAAGPVNAAQVADARCDSWSQYAPDSPAWAQTFTAEHTGPLTRARFYVATTVATTLEVAIHEVDDSGLPTGPALATTTLADVPARPNAGFDPLATNFVDAAFAPGPQVVAGGFYALTVKRVSPAGNLSVLAASPSAPEGPCPGVMFKDGNLDGTWESYGALAWANQYDMAMAIWVGDPGTVEPPPTGGGGGGGGAGGGDGGGGGGNPLPAPPQPPAPPLPPKPAPTVSITGTSLFFVDGKTTQVVTRVDAAGKVTVSVYGDAPRAASAAAKRRGGKGKPKPIRIGRKTVSVDRAGEVRLRVPISKAARKAIASKGKLKATLEVAFTPAGGGKATTKRKSITLKPKPAKRR